MKTVRVGDIPELAKSGDKWAQGMVETADRALESFTRKDRSFDCQLCATHFEPAPGQFIFWGLCDNCNDEFQRFRGEWKEHLWHGAPRPAAGEADWLGDGDKWVQWRLSRGVGPGKDKVS